MSEMIGQSVRNKLGAQFASMIKEQFEDEAQSAEEDNKVEHSHGTTNCMQGIDSAIRDRVEYSIDQIELKHQRILELEAEVKEINLGQYDKEQKRLVVLNVGDSFGEQALLDEKRGQRKARITCLDDCAFAVMHVTEYNESLKKIEKK